MLAKRIIPCLDIKDGQTVKGVQFQNLINVGAPVEFGKLYSDAGADELVFLDISASHEGRKTLKDLVKRIAANLSIPFTVGGGISSVADADALLSAGADKVSINSAALKNPKLINDLANKFGNQFVVLAVDAKCENNSWDVYLNGGRIKTDRTLFEWTKEATDRGCGEILFTSMNHDGEKTGFAIDPLAKLTRELSIPVIASGGAGNMEHFTEVFTEAKVEAALAASIFHFKEIEIRDLKDYLRKQNIPIR